MILIPKNWSEFQHYKDRRPPWIKLHRSLLDDRDFIMLPTASKALAPLLWLLASEGKEGKFNATPDELAFRLRMTASEIDKGIKPLLDKGFFLDASTMLAPCSQDAVPETERETERETEKRENPVKNLDSFYEKMPDSITSKWSADQIKTKAEDLVDYCKRKGKTYKDYYSALRSFLKKDYPNGFSKGDETNNYLAKLKRNQDD